MENINTITNGLKFDGLKKEELNLIRGGVSGGVSFDICGSEYQNDSDFCGCDAIGKKAKKKKKVVVESGSMNPRKTPVDWRGQAS